MNKIKEKGMAQGKLTLEDGSIYEGDIINGKPHGKGKLTLTFGIYEGDFVNGVRTGKAKLVYSNGDIYEGDYTNGKRTGVGKYTFANGESYEGDWVDANYHGKGKYTYTNGDIFEGIYENDVPQLKGKMIYTNGIVYEGDLIGSVPNGKGKMILTDGKVAEGNWKDGKFIIDKSFEEQNQFDGDDGALTMNEIMSLLNSVDKDPKAAFENARNISSNIKTEDVEGILSSDEIDKLLSEVNANDK
jgi:hypothetical protein